MKESIHYKHEVVYYVPCYEIKDNGSPAFTYSMTDATTDEQFAWSMKPDYVLMLKGTFDAKTQPYDEQVKIYNTRCMEEITS